MFDKIFGAASVALIAIGAVQPSFAQSVAADDCATGVHAIIARGQGPGNPNSTLDVMVTLQDLILAQIPGSTSLGLPFNYNEENKFDSVYNGAHLMQSYVTEYHKSCPQSKMAVVGYSLIYVQGAVVMTDAVCGTSSLLLSPVAPLDASYNKFVIAAIAYGDETFFPLQKWDKGNCTLGLGQFPRLDPAECEPFADALQNYCDIGDSRCCGILPLDGDAPTTPTWQSTTRMWSTS
ncbi:hypothetical protein N7468_008933 [Penicillium chermesinum]|uniref:Cutinase n=1 Tax=Penicillium chermesinum TaxID=63820 RepID=A0A9W9NJE5_9EURO|nr:uncharacterized protein N7468_008933 [Penicillium chermesinum]KAJ5219729.1 hypothetical protein N7468_008933 [Penicillium chermesinum]